MIEVVEPGKKEHLGDVKYVYDGCYVTARGNLLLVKNHRATVLRKDGSIAFVCSVYLPLRKVDSLKVHTK